MQNRFSSSPLSFVYDNVKKYKYIILFHILASPILVFMEQLVIWLVSRTIDLINSGKSADEVWQEVMHYVLPLILIITIERFSNIFMRIYEYYNLDGDASVEVRKKLFSSILDHSFSFWNANSYGSVYNKLDILKKSCLTDGGILGVFLNLYRRFLLMSVILFFICKIDVTLAVVLFVFSIVLSFTLYYFSQNVEDTSKDVSKAKADAFGKMVDMVANFFLIKTFGSKMREYKVLEHTFTKVQNFESKYYKSHLNHTIMQQLLSLILQLGLIFYAIYLWAQKAISVGDLVFVVATLQSLVMSFRILGYIILWLKSQIGSVKSAIDVFNKPYDIVDAVGAKNLKLAGGKIEFKNVSFSYDGNKEVLRGINLVIKPKEKVGIVGVSGSGKTTLIHLLQRVYDIDKGDILIDEQSIKKITRQSLYKAVSFIPQDTSLFHRSLKENISYGSFGARDKNIMQASKDSYVDEFVNRLPQGYDTYVGDKGIKLSGGQRQRVGICRAVLKDSAILLLDEATSALDSKSESFIQKSIKKMIKNKTVIAVAHRLSTLKEMDRIIVIDKGQIIEDDSPKKLLKNKGKFAELWEIQSNI